MERTPGRWKWFWKVVDGIANCGVYSEEHDGIARSICRAPNYVSKEQWEADARLIASAPELLEALEFFMVVAPDRWRKFPSDSWEKKAIRAGKQAIKKAKGA